jgi:transmembrane protein EpsG
VTILTVFLFLASGEYVQWTHNGMRQFIAVAMTFAATDLLLKKKYLLYMAVVLFASTFHASALMMIPMCLVVRGPAWNYKSVLMILGVIIATTSSDFLMNMVLDIMESTQYSGDIDNMMMTGGTNGIRVLVFAIPPLIALVFIRRIRALNVPLINLSVNMSIASLGIYIVSMFTSGIYIGRLPVYCSLYNYILLPWILERTFEKRTAKVIMLMAMGCYMVYYYFQMHVIWGL